MKRHLLLLGLLAAAPAAAQDVSIPHTTFRLPNGLTVIVNEDHSTPIVSVNVWYHVGSGYERAGRTGFAHLFEHVMFEGSRNVKEGDFDNLLEAAGGNNNGSTNTDRTNYFETVPRNALELALWLEADRMGGLLDALDQGKLDGQRDVVKNERRQRYENAPYGLLFETASAALYPQGHPYSWTTIGSMEDLSAASLEDVRQFFRTYYAPNNASIAISGDVETAEVRRLVERFFGGIPRGADVPKPTANVPPIAATRHIVKEDRVTLPEVSMIWRTGPRFSADEAALEVLSRVLSSGKSSRLHKRLVYDGQVAQFAAAFNQAGILSGDFWIRVRGRQNVDLNRLKAEVEEEIAKIAATPPTQEELARVLNSMETEFVSGLETVDNKSNTLNEYLYYTGDPASVSREPARFRAVTPADVQRVAREYLTGRNHIVISFVPQGRTELAVKEAP
jgi:zinc protease